MQALKEIKSESNDRIAQLQEANQNLTIRIDAQQAFTNHLQGRLEILDVSLHSTVEQSKHYETIMAQECMEIEWLTAAQAAMQHQVEELDHITARLAGLAAVV